MATEPGPVLENAIQSIAASLGTIAAFFASVWALIHRMRRKKSPGSDPERIHAVPRAAFLRERQADQLDRLAREVGGQRALLLKAHNGGQIPRASSTLKITIMAEAHAPSVQSVAGEYDARLLTDRGYLRMLSELDEVELMLLRTKDLPKRSMLRDEYEREGLSAAWICVVKRDPRRFFYLSVSSDRDFKDSPTERAAVRACAAKLSRLLEVDLSRTLDDVTG